jgi:hypothetical protein
MFALPTHLVASAVREPHLFVCAVGTAHVNPARHGWRALLTTHFPFNPRAPREFWPIDGWIRLLRRE